MLATDVWLALDYSYQEALHSLLLERKSCDGAKGCTTTIQAVSHYRLIIDLALLPRHIYR